MSIRLHHGPPARRVMKPPTTARNICGHLVERHGRIWTCSRLVWHNGRHKRRMTLVERWLRFW